MQCMGPKSFVILHFASLLVVVIEIHLASFKDGLERHTRSEFEQLEYSDLTCRPLYVYLIYWKGKL